MGARTRTLGKRDVERGQVHAEQRFFVEARDLYENISRDPMLYGALYGFGSSQYMHHWYGILVHWIGMEYALDLADLAALDDALPWKTLADGLISSGSWQTFDKAPYAGFFPDAFSVLRWVPSGPAFSPAALLSKTLGVELGAKLYDTVVVHDGEKRYHMTASRAVADAAVADGVLRFTIDDAGLPHCRVVVSGLNESAAVSVDGESLAATPALEEAEEGCMRTSQGLTVIKVRRLETPRRIEVTLAP